MTDHPRVLIAHDFSTAYGGAERIAASIAEAFPDAPFWSILAREEVVRRMGVADRAASMLPQRPFLQEHFRMLAPLYPLLVRSRSLPAADVLLTSSFAFAHGLRTTNHAPQVCYCYSPLRFAWTMTEDYGRRYRAGGLGRAAFKSFAGVMRAADRDAAKRVTRYVAESHYVAAQIERFYGRQADVIWPPVDCQLFRPGPVDHDDYFLFSGRLIEPYKQPTLVVEAFRSLPYRLVVAGDGPAMDHLKKIASPNVEFLGMLEDDQLVTAMQGAAATIFPSQDDFGLIPVESMACGRPVLAFAAGGALETVSPGKTGEFFERQDVATLRAAINAFDPDRYDPLEIRRHALQWSAERFQREIKEVVEETAAQASTV
jgi:glycosyltransferase involved in cell wall biosynthesis